MAVCGTEKWQNCLKLDLAQNWPSNCVQINSDESVAASIEPYRNGNNALQSMERGYSDADFAVTTSIMDSDKIPDPLLPNDL